MPSPPSAYGVVPDMICFAKGVTNGAVPLGGVMVRSDIHAAFMQGPEHIPELAHGFTYSGHRSASPRPLRPSTFIGTRRCSNGHVRSKLFADAVHALKGAPYVVDIRTVGLAAGIDLTPVDGAPGLRGARAFDAAFFDEDLVIRAVGDTLVLAPALIISEAEIASVVGKVARILATLR
jgi:beta-alanine--pyruvate transaminase